MAKQDQGPSRPAKTGQAPRLDPAQTYLVLSHCGPGDQARLLAALQSRSIPVLECRNEPQTDDSANCMLIVRIPETVDHTRLVMDLSNEGMGGDLTAYGTRMPARRQP